MGAILDMGLERTWRFLANIKNGVRLAKLNIKLSLPVKLQGQRLDMKRILGVVFVGFVLVTGIGASQAIESDAPMKAYDGSKVNLTSEISQYQKTPCMYNPATQQYQECYHVTADGRCAHFGAICTP